MTPITLYLHGQGITNATARAHCAWVKAVTGLEMTPLHYHDLIEDSPVQFLGRALKSPPGVEEDRQLAHYLAELDVGIETAELLPAHEITRAHLFETYRSAMRYLSRQDLTDEVRSSLLHQIDLATQADQEDETRISLVAHSLGSVIALDLLRHIPAGVHIDQFITLGSPLGLIASVPGRGDTMLPPETRSVTIPWFDIAAEGDLLANSQRVSRRKGFGGQPLSVTTVLGDHDNPHESYFIDPPVALAWTSACRQGFPPTRAFRQ